MDPDRRPDRTRMQRLRPFAARAEAVLPTPPQWQMDGCWVAPHCLTCLLPACKDDPASMWPGGLAAKIERLRERRRETGYTGKMSVEGLYLHQEEEERRA